MRKFILLIIGILSFYTLCYAAWKYNPHTGKLDYYESGGGTTSFDGTSPNALLYIKSGNTAAGAPLLLWDNPNNQLNLGVGTTANSSTLYIRGAGTGTGFALRIADSTPTDKLVVMDNGNVGIGNTAPTEKLEIAGDVKITDATPHLEFEATTGDDFEITADNNQFWIANLDDTKKPFMINQSNLIQFYEQAGFIFPDGAPADNQILKYDLALGRLAWEVDATGAGGGNSVYLEEGDVAKLDNSAADMTIDFDATDFETAVVGTELNLTIPDDGHAHTTTSLSGIDISADTNLTAGTNITLTDDDLSVDDVFLLNAGDIGTGVYDFGGATSVEIPNAAAPTVDAAGEIAVDTTDDQLVYYGGAKRVIPYTYEKCFSLETPAVADDNWIIWFPNDAITITSMYCGVNGGTSAEMQVSDGTNACESIVCDADFQADDGTLTNNTFTANERMEFDTIAVTGTVPEVTYCIRYTYDAQ